MLNPPTLKNCKKCGAELPEEAELITGANNSEQDGGSVEKIKSES